MFSIAAGGLEAGETIRDAARREAGEEPDPKALAPKIDHQQLGWLLRRTTAVSLGGATPLHAPNPTPRCPWPTLSGWDQFVQLKAA